jgi:diguanylate cyclase (GGDEF)-like protein
MKDQRIGSPSLTDMLIVIISAFACTVLMSSLHAYERLYLFTRIYKLQLFQEFAVFLPAFLAMGFSLLYYHQIQKLESEVARRRQVEKELRESEQRYKELSITDDLTRLYNLRHFYNQLKQEIDRSIRYNNPLSLLLIDIDDFKHYNDTYGHMEGDKVLSCLGKVVRECLRITDSAFRYGGEEFIVILPETKGEDAINVAERIRKGFEAEILSPRPTKAVHNTVSIGASQYETKEELEVFIKRADKAMYIAKEQGKNRVHLMELT